MSAEEWLWLEPVRWVGGFILCAFAVVVLCYVLDAIGPPILTALRWVEKYLFYGLYRSGLYHCARTYKLLVGAIGFIAAGILAFHIGFWLCGSNFSDDFTFTACMLGLAICLLGLGLFICAIVLVANYFGDDADPYASARQTAAAVFEQMDTPVFGRGGRATLKDVKDAGHYPDEE